MFRHDLVRSMLAHYAERAGYAGRFHVFTRRDAFDRLCRRRKSPLIAADRAGYAVTLYGRTPAVWVNAEIHKTVAALADTCAHEALHLVSGPSVRCETASGERAPKFQTRVRRLLRGLPPG